MTVTTTVTPGVQLATTPSTVTTSTDEGVASMPTTLALNFTNGTATSWTPEVVYPQGNGSGWLTLTPSGNSLQVNTGSLIPATYQATIRITYQGPNYQNTIAVPVSYTVRAQPSVEFVSPYIAVVGEARSVVVRGRGFDRMTRSLKFDGIDATSVTKISDTELRATPPAFTTAGTRVVSIANDAGITTSTANLVIVPGRTYPYASVSVANGNNSILVESQIFHDAERQAVYIKKNSPGFMRMRFVAGAWVMDALNVPDSALWMKPSVDGKKLYMTASGVNFLEYDLDANTVSKTHSLSIPLGEQIDNVTPLNNGKVLVHYRFSVESYDFRLNRMTSVPYNGGYDMFTVSSPDGGKVIALTDGTGAGMFRFSATTETFGPKTSNAGGSWQIAMDRHADRTVVVRNVYDKNDQLLGQLDVANNPENVMITPDGTRAYLLNTAQSPASTQLRVYDISGTAGPFPQVGGTITVPEYAGNFAKGVISPDGRTMFLSGSQKFIVFPLP